MSSDNLKEEMNLSTEQKRALLAELWRKKKRAPKTFPVSFAQQRLWFLDQLEPNNPFYNITTAVSLAGALDVSALQRSINEIVRRHETLRTTFALVEGLPAQVVHADSELPIDLTDLSALPSAEREDEARRLMKREAGRSFNLDEGPLLRLSLLRLAEHEHVLLLAMHHIISDGWSMEILVRELTTLYEAFEKGARSPLAELAIQYVDFAQWQRRWLTDEVLERQTAYWTRQLAGVAVLALPTDRPRPPIRSYQGARYSFSLTPALSDALKAFSLRENVTVFMTLLAAFKTLLHRYTDQDDVVVGAPIAGRNRKETEELIGFFVNTLVLRTDMTGDPSFRELLARVKESALGAYANQDLPFEMIVERLQPERSLSHTPLFQVVFAWQNAAGPDAQLQGMNRSRLSVESNVAKFDLTLTMGERAQGLGGAFDYSTDLYEAATIERMVGHFQTLLAGILATPDARLWELPLLTYEERERLPSEIARRAQDEFAPPRCLIDLFSEQVLKTPERVAVIDGAEGLTYAELNARANRLAHHLQALGVGPEVLVGICLERSVEMVLSLLGVLKAGGAYLPLDPGYPGERLAFMLEDAAVPLVLTQASLVDSLPRCAARMLCVDSDGEAISGESAENPCVNVRPDNLAYVIYTSGSTGKPKGAQVTHANVARLFSETRSLFNFDEHDVWTLFHSYAFDFSVWELWGALLYGGRLVIVPYLLSRTPEAFYQLLKEQRVTILNQTPSAFRQLSQVACASRGEQHDLTLRAIIFGGEALELQGLQPWVNSYGDERPQLINMYGITETTVHVTYRRITAANIERNAGSVIGSPIADLQVYVLDRRMRHVPFGVPGEMYVGGAGLARGYLRRAETTAERFLPHPYSEEAGERLYRTGDLARYLSDGDLEYLGRIDQQVKVRGFRIELGEIEAALAEHPEVVETIVLATTDETGHKSLTAYVVGRAKDSLSPGALRLFLKEKLPEYMIPQAFIMMDVMPLTPNGKVNRQALPLPAKQSGREKLYAAPRTAVEKALAQAWTETLGVDRVGLQDNFFDLGGDSIRSIQLRARAQQLGVEFSIQQLFQYQTIEELARAVDETHDAPAATTRTEPLSLISEADRALLPEDVEDAYPLAMLQAGMLFHSEFNPAGNLYHNVSSAHLKAAFDGAKLRAALNRLASRHPVLRTSMHPSGYSEPMQLVHRDVEIPLEIEDLRHLTVEEQERAVRSCIEAERNRRFNWQLAPLIRFRAQLRGPETFQLTWTEHHAILDGWSIASLLTELFHLYSHDEEEAGSTLAAPLSVTYRDFVALEREALGSDDARRYWQEKLSDHEATVLPRSQTQGGMTGRGVFSMRIPGDVSVGLKRLASDTGVPLKSVLLAAHLRVLGLLGGQSDVVTGLVANGRPEEEDGERVLGLFLNTVPFRLRLNGGSWRDLVRETFEAEREMLPYRRYPMAQLQSMKGQQPLFEAAFNYVHFHVYEHLQSSARAEVLAEISYAETNFPLTVTFNQEQSATRIVLVLEYDTSGFSREQVEAFGGYYLKALGAMALYPAEPYGSRSLLSEREERQQLEEWNDTHRDYAPNLTLHKLFEAQVARTPESMALIFEDGRLTYAELDARAGCLANYLREMGVGPEMLVGVLMERSVEMVVALLGVLKAGAAYVPFDPSYPQERLAFMLEDSAVAVLLTQERLALPAPESKARTIAVDALWPEIERRGATMQAAFKELEGENLAYVIYTSGSTGRPKGAMNTHAAICNRLLWMQEQYGLDASDSVLQKTPFSFDVSVWEFFWPLITGAQMVLARPGGHRDNAYLIELIKEQRITTLHFVPSMLYVFLEEPEVASLDSLRRVICSGEALSHELQERYFARLKSPLHNLYGPTEAAVDVTFWECSRTDSRGVVPIGKPVANTHIYLLDRHMQPLPVGVAGELHIGGVQLARGYLNRPELTAEKFIPDAFSAQPGSRLYRTGDLARLLPEGNIEFLGRSDYQVKLRGFRLELGEIEAALEAHPAIQEAVVIAAGEQGAHAQHLVAYLVPKQQGASSLKRFLRLEQEGKLANSRIYELPDSRLVVHQNRGETDFLYQEIFQERTYLQHGITLDEDSCIFDVGANIGLFSLFMGTMFPKSTIYAFEPIPPVFDTLSLNAQIHGLNTRLFKCGLSNETRTEQFTYYPHLSIISGRFANQDQEREVVKSFLLNESHAGVNGASVLSDEEIEEVLSERLASESYLCELRTVSEIIRREKIERIDLLKIDVEKSEMDVLAGIAEEDWSRIRQLIVEVHDMNGRLERIVSLLERHGYHLKVQQDRALKDSPLYNIYALRPHGEKRVESDSEGRSTRASEEVWTSPWQLIEDVKSFLKQRLPEHMLPSHFIPLPEMPLSPSGKVDRRALPAPGLARSKTQEPQVSARDVLEFRLVSMWSDVLGVRPIGVHDNFFEIGGHSILALRLIARLEQEVGERLPLAALFQARTIENVAVLLRERQQQRQEQQKGQRVIHPTLVKIQPEGTKRPFFCVHPGGGHVLCYLDLARHMGTAQPFYAFQSGGVDGGEEPLTDVRAMASRYLEEMFMVQPEGPYLLGGYSLGGIIAFEMAQQLRARGQRVSLLVLIDSRAPGFDAGDTEEGRDRRMLIFARELGLSPERLTLSSDHLRTLGADEKLLYVLAEATKQNLLPPGIEPRQIRSLWKVFEANFRAASRYAPRVYDGPLTLFKAVNKPAGSAPALHEGWHALTRRGVEIKALPGDHFSIVREPHVETLAEMLTASIREIEREEVTDELEPSAD